MIHKQLNNEIAYFCKSLTVEKKDINLPFPELLQSRVLVTERRNGKIAGIAGISKKKSFFLVVKSECHNQKIGQKLTREVIDHAKKKNYHYITLNVFQSNVKAIHIYRKFGFTVLFTNLMSSRENFFMMLPLDFKGSLYKIYFLMAHKLRSIIRRMPHELLCTVRRLSNKVKDVS
jgi:hypothetical protein